jgi:hypothetical protein
VSIGEILVKFDIWALMFQIKVAEEKKTRILYSVTFPKIVPFMT